MTKITRTLDEPSSHWHCTKCGDFYADPEDVESDDGRKHNTEVHEIICPQCDQKLTWVPLPWTHEYTRKAKVTFDYAFQVYRTDDGKAVESKEGWDFSCAKCGGPSTLTHFNAYYEYYSCINCDSKQKVH